MPEPGVIDVWPLPVHIHPAATSAILTPLERIRAGRFLFPRDRDAFVRRTTFLREVLGQYMDLPPSAVPIHRTAAGKPFTDPGAGLSFNLSHSDGMAVVAVARGMEVGVDIERLRSIDDVEDLATGLFAPREVAYLAALDPLQRCDAFLRLWTRKEAVVKASGVGLSMPLDRFGVLGPTVRGSPIQPHATIRVTSLDGLPGFACSVATLGPLGSVRWLTAAGPWPVPVSEPTIHPEPAAVPCPDPWMRGSASGVHASTGVTTP